MQSELDRQIHKLASVIDQQAGLIVGLAAIIAELPETAHLDQAKIKRHIGQLVGGVFGSHELRAQAEKMMTAVLQTAGQRASRQAG
jgi:hypothetical protein